MRNLQNTVNQHVPDVAKVGRATLHSPIPDDLGADLVKATSILEHFIKGTNQMDSALIPPKVIANAKGKGGFLWSGRLGSGIVVAKLPDGKWSAPSAIAAGGAGFGAQVGAQLTDCVFILNNNAAVKEFSHGGNVTFGGSMAVAAGPKERQAEAAGYVIRNTLILYFSFNSVMNLAPIYSYSKSKGLFAGFSLEGSVTIARNDANRALYGGRKLAPPIQADALYRVLDLKFGNMATGEAKLMPYAKRTLSRKAGSTLGKKNSVVNKNGVAPLSATSAGSLSRGSTGKLAPALGVSRSHSNNSKRSPQPIPAPQPIPEPVAAATTVVALYDFVGERQDDLTFPKGDQSTVLQGGGPNDWWTGRVNGKEGSFPGNYCAPV
ncbi:hypothetical protein BDZ88DRAFT_445333 [Geranomyces variabilis]|nr:hypothetical protein BDZ88DRAFT_445333 [Geranomyces variabilis]